MGDNTTARIITIE